jgi:mannose-1-phosphate guanylyltransferase
VPKGMILAAGRGTRLQPLTDTLPKPLLPVANIPVMASAIACLRQVGITEVWVNVCYRAADIRHAFTDAHHEGIHLHWSEETEMAGTAGGLKRVQEYLGDDRIVVIAGDALLDVDLAPLLAAHEANNAFATLGAMRVADTARYGVVETDTRGRIRGFQEKPAAGTARSDEANTGIYVFEPGIFDYIPARGPYDFALHVFPDLLSADLPFFAAPVTGYWTDVGCPHDYLQANLDYLAGNIRLTGQGQRVGDNLVGSHAEVTGARLTQCVVGDGAVIPPGSALTECVVWPGTVLTAPLVLHHGIATPVGVYEVAGTELRRVSGVG